MSNRAGDLRQAALRLAVMGMMALPVAPAAQARADVFTGAGTRTQQPELSFLPDFSGLAWIEGNLFVAVHDTKHSRGIDQPRVSLLTLPTSQTGIQAQVPQVNWPEPHAPSHDLESIARIPGTRQMLLVESGDDSGRYRRIFLANLDRRKLMLTDFMHWPVPITNVEGSAVARVGGQLVFLYAERAHGQPSTLIRWAPLDLQPLGLGRFAEARFVSPGPRGGDSRPVTALEVDPAGTVYAASALDPGRDGGPFGSRVWRIGRLALDDDGQPDLVLMADPQLIATLDGVKVESLAIRQQTDGYPELFVGTDDENFGGTMRLIPLSPSSTSGS
ncbi:MAG: hypothetical protein VKJ63_04645 [Synechococcus sp.]|nr:hypothetical protein [Synechococcus sp.]